mmetsp:Transcript_69865/g.158528  ORF Transcript_69865/g.158528 Transcript_69865/m.158528 type:complete len:189 (+) Transcript_69865:55-621(+)
MAAVPSLDVQFEISVAGFQADEFSLLDKPPDCNPARLEELKRELSQPHSMTNLRLKDKLEKVINAEASNLSGWAPKVPERPATPPKPPTQYTVKGELGLREPPKATGHAYMVKGPTTDAAPFMGFKHEFTGKTEVNLDSVALPPMYQPYRPEREWPHGQEPPSTERPTGVFKKPADDRGLSFTLARPA